MKLSFPSKSAEIVFVQQIFKISFVFVCLNTNLIHNASGVEVPTEIPTDEFSGSFIGTSGLENKSSNQDVLIIDHDLPIDISRKFSAVSEGSSDYIPKHDLKSSNEIDRKTEVGASGGEYEEEFFDEEAV
jgi:hypothetical protein